MKAILLPDRCEKCGRAAGYLQIRWKRHEWRCIGCGGHFPMRKVPGRPPATVTVDSNVADDLAVQEVVLSRQAAPAGAGRDGDENTEQEARQ